MIKNYKKLYFWFVYCCVSPVYLLAAPSVYEQEIADSLVRKIEQGEVVWLNAGNEKFLGIYHQHLMEQAQGAAIIVHGMGGHPDWPEVVSPLRINLPVGGWATLSIQMPVLEPGDELASYGKTIISASNRIRSAVQYLREKKFLNIVIVGHSFGATTSAYYLAENRSSIQAFVGISMQSYDFLNPRLNLNSYLERVNIPVLDIYGSRDFYEVLRLAGDRRLQARRMNKKNYQQITIEGADHYFTDLEDVIIRRIRGWLDKAAPGVRVIADDVLKNKIESSARQEQLRE